MGEEKVTTIALPFYHMQSEPFWELHYKSEVVPYRTSPSLGGLRSRVQYAEVDEALFKLLTDSGGRQQVRQVLLDRYFSPDTVGQILELAEFNDQTFAYAGRLGACAAEPFMIDHTSEKEVAYSVTKSPVRDAGFSLSVRRAYDYTCAVCRSRLVTATGNTLVDGAHIIPFKSSRNDDPRNGLALCKSHHWMFDHFMLAIRPDYKIHLSKWMNGNDNRVEETMRCDKHSIMLPSDQGLHPAGEALEYQYERFQGVQ